MQTRDAHPEQGRYTWADFIALDEDDPRELVDGELLEIEVPTGLHEWIVSALIMFIGTWARARRAGVVFASGYKVRITDRRGVMPDVQFYRRGRKIPEQGLEEGGPDLAIEVISPSSRGYDRVRKLEWYASIGVAEYWIVDPEGRTLECFRRAGEQFVAAQGATGDEVFKPPTFEGLEIPLAELWTIPLDD